MNVSYMLAYMCALSAVKLISLFFFSCYHFYGEIKICKPFPALHCRMLPIGELYSIIPSIVRLFYKFCDDSFFETQCIFFYTKHYGNSPTETPKWGVKCTCGMKNRDFRPISLFISEMMQDVTIVSLKRQTPIYRMVSFPVTLMTFNPAFKSSPLLDAEYLKNDIRETYLQLNI